jgi:sulfate permease, SulP family
MALVFPPLRGKERETELIAPLKSGWGKMATAWAGGWRDVFTNRAIGFDIIAGVTVAAVALPLNLALAVASNMPPMAGLVAGAVGGTIAAMMGGATLQVTGPAAALSSMVFLLAAKFGATGVAAATLMIGLLQIGLGLGLAGRLARYVPEAVLAGFTTGVGLKLLDQQIPEILGFDYKVSELAQMMHRPAWLHEVSWHAVVCGLFVAFFVSTLRQFKRFPAAIVAIALVTFVSSYVGWELERVGMLPSEFPRPSLPLVPDDQWLDLIIATLPLALLASVESLLSASVVDRMAVQQGLKIRPHEPNLELFGQGFANTAVGLMSGMPVTGVVVRSGVNLQSGARTRVSALLHAVLLAVCVLYLGDVISRVPLAALAGLLCVIGFRLIELGELVRLARHERILAAAFLVTAAGTVTGHLMAGLVGGLILGAVHHYLHRGEATDAKQIAHDRARGVRAVLGKERAEARRPYVEHEGPHAHTWIAHVRATPHQPRSAFVHDKASVIGRVVMGDHVHIAAGSSVRADEGTPFFIGSNSNLQDGVVVHALKQRRVMVAGEEWAVYIGKNVSIAHDALVHGPCYIGDDSFVGFKAVVHDSIVGAHCFIGHGALVVGVEIPDGKHVPNGRIVDSADAVDKLPDASHAHAEFNEDVVDVNRGLAAAYRSVDEAPPRRGPGARVEIASRPERVDPFAEGWGPTRIRRTERF